MKFRLLLLFSTALPALVHAETGDTQSIYRVSGTTLPMTSTSTSTLSPVLPNDCRAIRVAANVDSHIVFGGPSATATISSTFLPAKTPEYFKIQPTDGNYVAVIRDGSTDGKVWLDTMRP